MQTNVFTPPTDLAPIIKKMTWETNYNHKMDCDSFLHIQDAPKILPHEEYLQLVNNYVFEICTKDSSHAPIMVQLVDVFYFKLKNCSPYHAIASHGMDNGQFIEYFLASRRYSDTNITVAVYVYRKLNNNKVYPQMLPVLVVKDKILN